MQRIFSLQPVYFKKLQTFLIISILPFITFSFLRIGSNNPSYSIYYLLATILLAIVITGVFFLNRNEVSDILIDHDTVTFQFINKAFFKKKPLKAKLSTLTNHLDNNKIEINYNGDLAAVLRKESMKLEEWNEILEIFTK